VGHGDVKVTTGAGAITGGDGGVGDGIDASTQGGDLTIKTGTGTVQGDPGIIANINGGSGTLSITAGGSVIGTLTDGVEATIAGGGTGAIIIHGNGGAGSVISGGVGFNGIEANTNGGGNIDITTVATTAVTGASMASWPPPPAAPPASRSTRPARSPARPATALTSPRRARGRSRSRPARCRAG